MKVQEIKAGGRSFGEGRWGKWKESALFYQTVITADMTYFRFLKLLFSALHLAVMHGRLNNIRVLLTECNVDAEAFNIR